ncbi:MAG: DUF6497 family protein [Paracoccaceae bacterium]
MALLRDALLLSVTALPAFAAADVLDLPSGRAVTFLDVVHGAPGPGGLTVRFRFIEPDLRAVIDTTPYDELEADMHFLCETYAVEQISNIGPQPSTVMISISDRPVEFGAQDPDVVQIFEAYRPESGACIWEGF